MKKEVKEEDFLRLLVESSDWPTDYIYKFIVPNTPDKVEATKKLFGEKAEIKEKPSKNGNYISFTAKVYTDKPQDVIEVYKQSHKIEGLFAL